MKLGAKASSKSVLPERQESHLDSRTKCHNPWRLAQTPWASASGPGPDARVSGVWPLTSAKLSFAPTYSCVGLTPWPNHIIQYMNLYLRTIPELLVMSVISSGTPDNIQSPTYITHIILYRQRTLSVRTLRVRELCRHDRDTSLVNNQ